MKGYIIASGKSYLAKRLYWYEYNKPEDAFVFSPNGFMLVIETCGSWDKKPTHAFEATYDETSGSVTVGKKIEI